MRDYSKLYKKRYEYLSAEERFAEIKRIIKKDIKPLAMLAAIIVVAQSRP